MNEAKEAVKRANFVLIAAGAGFSADSGLPVYKDIAYQYEELGFDYQDLCDPDWFFDDVNLAYGFWIGCRNEYRKVKAHDGYGILKKWENLLIKKANGLYQPFFIYTSNVDGHFHRYFDNDILYEIHGNVELFQCAGKNRKSQICSGLFRNEKQVDVDPKTLLANDASIAYCPKCKAIARPNVLMFRDKQWIPNINAEKRYIEWEAIMENNLEQNTNLQLVIIEIGCGTRVPSVRLETEMVVADTRMRNGNATLIRINPEPPSDEDTSDIYLEGNGLKILTELLDNDITSI